MISTQALGQAILALLVYDKKNALVLASKVNPELFQSRINRTIAKSAITYIKEYRQPPGDQIEILLENELRRGDEGKLLSQILDGLEDQFKALQPEFVLSELSTWEESEIINKAAQDAIEAVARGDIAAAKTAMLRRRNLVKEESTGVWLSDPVGMLRSSDTSIDEFFSSGVDAIDKLKLIPQRKTISCWMASTRRGKSWALVNTVRAGVQYGRSSLVITLELSKEKWAQRLVQSLFSVTKDETRELKVPFFPEGMPVDYRQLKRESITERRKDIQKKLAEATSWPRVLIKDYATGMLSFDQFLLFLDSLADGSAPELQQFGGEPFKPDQIVIDAPHNMNIDMSQFRLTLGRLWINLRGVAVERNAAVIAASQGNREGEGSTTLGLGNVAEDWSIAGTVDGLYTINQTDAEKSLGLCRIQVAKYRDEADGVMILNSQAYSIGQFSLDSKVMSKDYSPAPKPENKN